MLVGLWRSSNYSFHHRIIDSVEVSNSPLPLKIMWTGLSFPLLSHRTVCQNFFGTDWKSCLHGLIQLHPYPGFCLSDYLSRRSLGLPVSVCCLRCPTSQPLPVSLLQLDSFHLGVHQHVLNTITSTSELLPQLQAAVTRMTTENIPHSDAKLPNTSRMWLTPLEEEVKDHFQRVHSKMVPADPYYCPGPAWSFQLPSPPTDPTHQHLVIS